MDANSVDYYRLREARQQAMADAAVSPAIAALHHAMIRAYRARIDEATGSLPV